MLEHLIWSEEALITSDSVWVHMAEGGVYANGRPVLLWTGAWHLSCLAWIVFRVFYTLRRHVTGDAINKAQHGFVVCISLVPELCTAAPAAAQAISMQNDQSHVA